MHFLPQKAGQCAKAGGCTVLPLQDRETFPLQCLHGVECAAPGNRTSRAPLASTEVSRPCSAGTGPQTLEEPDVVPAGRAGARGPQPWAGQLASSGVRPVGGSSSVGLILGSLAPCLFPSTTPRSTLCSVLVPLVTRQFVCVVL